jgi:hypothetical protein
MRALLIALAITASLAPAAHAASEPPLTDADYLAFADRIVANIRATYDATQGVYTTRHMGATARTNANLLLIHATAARVGHTGPARQDDRARALIEAMTTAPMYEYSRHRAWTGRTVCWSKRLTSSGRDHVSLDSQIAEALAAAHRARAQLRLSRQQADRIARIIDRCAHHPAWRFPRILKNQFNWNAQLYAAAAEVTGHQDLLRRDYRRHLIRFAAAIERPRHGMASANLGRGLGFHYHPELPASEPRNFDSPEYAHIVATALQYHAAARAANMARLPRKEVKKLRRWVTRLLLGSWTHAGYLNWDTGLAQARWHSGQYWAFAQQGLLAIAVAPAFWERKAYGRWAKALFDRGLLLYARWGDEDGTGIAPKLPFDVFSEHRDHDLYASRIAANAMRALTLGLGRMRAADPPPLYHHDRDTGRLAVTTPRYSTAIVPDNRGAFAYGGIELARLYGAGQRVAATTGGRPPSAFGVVIRDAAGRALLASQGGRARTRIRLLDRAAPSGSFRRLRVKGTIARAGLRITTTHRFEPASIDVRWDIRCRGGCAGREIDVQLPTWGEDATISVQPPGGAATPLAAPLPLGPADTLQLGTGYTVTPVRVPAGATLLPLRTAPQPTAPHPGPTLAVRLDPGAASATSLAVHITPH